MPQINGKHFSDLSALRRLEIEESNVGDIKHDSIKDVSTKDVSTKDVSIKQDSIKDVRNKDDSIKDVSIKSNKGLTPSMNHEKSIHEDARFPCDQCDYKSPKKFNLLRHIRSKHEGVKFPCDTTEKKATEASLLARRRFWHQIKRKLKKMDPT